MRSECVFVGDAEGVGEPGPLCGGCVTSFCPYCSIAQAGTVFVSNVEGVEDSGPSCGGCLCPYGSTAPAGTEECPAWKFDG